MGRNFLAESESAVSQPTDRLSKGNNSKLHWTKSRQVVTQLSSNLIIIWKQFEMLRREALCSRIFLTRSISRLWWIWTSHLSSAHPHPLHCKTGAARQLNVKSRYRKISELRHEVHYVVKPGHCYLLGPASAERPVVHWPTLNYRPARFEIPGMGGRTRIMVGWMGWGGKLLVQRLVLHNKLACLVSGCNFGLETSDLHFCRLLNQLSWGDTYFTPSKLTFPKSDVTQPIFDEEKLLHFIFVPIIVAIYLYII